MSRIPSSPSFGNDDQLRALREAFKAIKLESASSPRNSISNGQSNRSELPDAPHTSTRRRHNSELAIPSGTVQTASERRATLEELWMDSNSNYTLSCLESQFKQMHGIDTTRLTRDDYEYLLQANFRALNKEIVRDNMLFIEEVQLQEHLQNEKRRMQLQVQQPLFDQQYSAGNEAYYSHMSYPPMDSLLSGHHSRHDSSGNVSSSRNSIEAPSASLHHSHIYYPPYPPPTPDEHQDNANIGGRSSSWSSPMREPPIDAAQTRPRGASHADYVHYYPAGVSIPGMHQHYPDLFPANGHAPSSPSRPHPYGYDPSPPRSSRESPREGSPGAEAR